MDALQVEKYLDPAPYMGICHNLNIFGQNSWSNAVIRYKRYKTICTI